MARGATAQRVVGFATEVKAIRPPGDAEQSVMDHFARHAARCEVCKDPEHSYKHDIPLCDRGNTLAMDVAKYVYSKGGKPFSVVDRLQGKRIQLEIPPGCQVINSLVRAFDRGMIPRARNPVVVTQVAPTPTQPSTPRVQRGERVERTERPASYYHPRTERRREYPAEEYTPRATRYRSGDVQMVEIVPSSARRERREQVYRDRLDERYRQPERRPRPVSYMERRGSLYHRDEQENKQRQRYEEQPIVIVAEPRRRYASVRL
ncbi:hypothetical protein ABEF95_011856 [Exophiala dermatitidis]